MKLKFNRMMVSSVSEIQETKLLPEGSKISHILGYQYKNLRLKVSFKWFLKRGALLYCIRPY